MTEHNETSIMFIAWYKQYIKIQIETWIFLIHHSIEDRRILEISKQIGLTKGECEQMKLKIMEWNINQRMNYAGADMPSWISEIIVKEKADLISLTEVYRGNNWERVKKEAFNSDYAVFETSNNSAGQNDIAIAINTKKLDIIYAKTNYSGREGIPDHLEVKCKNRENGKEFVFVCMRIHASVSDDVKKKELNHVIAASKNSDTVIICGDFNNYRRGFSNDKWCLKEIKSICQTNNFVIKTPDGSSIYEENLNNIDYQFAEDHFLLKGIKEKDFILLPYDRDFVKKDKKVYKWGRDFQIYLGKDDMGKNMYDSVPAPFPDHAILKCEMEI